MSARMTRSSSSGRPSRKPRFSSNGQAQRLAADACRLLVAQFRRTPRAHFAAREVDNAGPLALTGHQRAARAQLDIIGVNAERENVQKSVLGHGRKFGRNAQLPGSEGDDLFAHRVRARLEGGHQTAFFVHQKLVEVPTDFVIADAVLLRLAEPAVHGVLVVALLHNHLRHHLKGHAVILRAELCNLSCTARLLTSELVAGEPEDYEVVSMGLMQRLQLVLVGVSAAASGVHDEHALALELGEIKIATVEGGGRQGMEVGHGCCRSVRPRNRQSRRSCTS